ncbi:MAG: STM3941 family protein [Candidatus Eisenbacteria bacterium]
MIEFQFVRRKQWIILVGTLVIATGFTWIALDAHGKLAVYAWAAVAIFGVFAPMIHLPRLFMRGPAMRIDARGIEDFRAGIGLLPWEEIAALQVRNALLAKALEVYPKDPWAVVKRFPLTWRWIAAINVMGGKPALLVQFQDIEPGLEEALKTIEVLRAAEAAR